MVPYTAVCGILGGTACISDSGFIDSVQLPEPGIGAPESSKGKGRLFERGRYVSVDRGNSLSEESTSEQGQHRGENNEYTRRFEIFSLHNTVSILRTRAFYE